MKKRFQSLIFGMLIGTMLTSGMVFAKQASETISVIYNNIKILIDGKDLKKLADYTFEEDHSEDVLKKFEK